MQQNNLISDNFKITVLHTGIIKNEHRPISLNLIQINYRLFPIPIKLEGDTSNLIGIIIPLRTLHNLIELGHFFAAIALQLFENLDGIKKPRLRHISTTYMRKLDCEILRQRP